MYCNSSFCPACNRTACICEDAPEPSHDELMDELTLQASPEALGLVLVTAWQEMEDERAMVASASTWAGYLSEKRKAA